MNLKKSALPLLALVFASFGCASGSSGDGEGPGPNGDAGSDTSTIEDSTPADSSVPIDTGLADDTGSTNDDTGSISDDTGSTNDDTGAISTDSGSTADVADGETPAPWPTCDTQPTGTTPMTVQQIWTANPSTPEYAWISPAFVTAVSGGGCVSGKACDVFIADGTSYADLTAATHHGVKIFLSAQASAHFAGIAVGDQVDVAGWGVRYTVGGQNELLVEVNDLLRGCFKKTGSGTVAPVKATLAQLGVTTAYEAYGAVVVEVDGVSGKPDTTPTTTFGLWTTGTFDAGGASIVSLSPFYLPGSAFTGLTAGTTTNFASITGVFGIFQPPGAADAGPSTTYYELYPRQMAEVITK